MKEKHSFHLILTVFMVATGLLQMRPLLAQVVAPKPAILVAQAQDNLISKEAMASNAAAATKGLSLSQVLDAVAATYPILVAARTEAKAAGQDLQATERLRWPTVSAVVESDTGNLRSSPNRAVQVEQTVWDAGRNSSRISESKVLADISVIKVQFATAGRIFASCKRLAILGVCQRAMGGCPKYVGSLEKVPGPNASPCAGRSFSCH